MRQCLLDNHPDVADSLIGVGVVCTKVGNHEQALDYYQRALHMRQRLFSGNHLDVAASLYSLGVSYERLE